MRGVHGVILVRRPIVVQNESVDILDVHVRAEEIIKFLHEVLNVGAFIIGVGHDLVQVFAGINRVVVHEEDVYIDGLIIYLGILYHLKHTMYRVI